MIQYQQYIEQDYFDHMEIPIDQINIVRLDDYLIYNHYDTRQKKRKYSIQILIIYSLLNIQHDHHVVYFDI